MSARDEFTDEPSDVSGGAGDQASQRHAISVLAIVRDATPGASFPWVVIGDERVQEVRHLRWG